MKAFIRSFLRIVNGISWRLKYLDNPLARTYFASIAKSGKPKQVPFWLNRVQKIISSEILRMKRDYVDSRSVHFCRTISVVIPHYNQQEVIGETIDSILKQTYPAFEIIIVDDVSTNRELTAISLSKYASCQTIKAYYPDEKLYVGGARNYGIDKATGDLVVFIDADDIMHPQRLEIFMRLFSENPSATFAITGTVSFSGKPPPFQLYTDNDYLLSLIEPSEILSELSKAFSRSRLSWIDPKTKKVPWYAWGSFGIQGKYHPAIGAVAVRKSHANTVRFRSPKNYTFTPYEDLEYCLYMQAITNGGYQIDLPLLYYRRGYTTSKPMESL